MSKRGKTLRSSTREMIFNVYQFCQREKEAQKPIIDLKKVTERVAAMTGFSKETISKIKKEGAANDGVWNTDKPIKKRKAEDPEEEPAEDPIEESAETPAENFAIAMVSCQYDSPSPHEGEECPGPSSLQRPNGTLPGSSSDHELDALDVSPGSSLRYANSSQSDSGADPLMEVSSKVTLRPGASISVNNNRKMDPPVRKKKKKM